MKMAVFWVLWPCNLIEIYRRFRGACCLHHQDAISYVDGLKRDQINVNLVCLLDNRCNGPLRKFFGIF
jgi:hypothetical protein